MPTPKNFSNPFVQSRGIGINDNPKVMPWRVNNPNIPYSSLDNNLLSYMDSLPIELQKNIKVTSSTGDSHSKNSRHYKGRALDIRIDNKDNPYEDPLFKYLGSDNSRRDKNIVVLDVEHGTAPHIHLSYGEGTENNLDYFYGASSNITPSFTPSNTPSLIPSLPEEVDNSAFIEEIRNLVSMAGQYQEQEKQDKDLTEAKEYLLAKQQEYKNKLEFLKEFQLQYETVDYSGDQEGIPQYASGGPVPIYTTNRNDPKLKSYNDSLNLYNSYKDQVKDATELFQRELLKEFKRDRYLKGTKNYNETLDFSTRIWGIPQHPTIKPTAIYKTGETPLSGLREYKKPTQPVLYKPKPRNSSNTNNIIYVNDPNDPKLKKYIKELDLYNTNKNIYNSSGLPFTYDDELKSGAGPDGGPVYMPNGTPVYFYRKPSYEVIYQPRPKAELNYNDSLYLYNYKNNIIKNNPQYKDTIVKDTLKPTKANIDTLFKDGLIVGSDEEIKKLKSLISKGYTPIGFERTEDDGYIPIFKQPTPKKEVKKSDVFLTPIKDKKETEETKPTSEKPTQYKNWELNTPDYWGEEDILDNPTELGNPYAFTVRPKPENAAPTETKSFRYSTSSSNFRPDLAPGTEIILLDNKWITAAEFEEIKKQNPNIKYNQMPDSIGRIYKTKQ